MRLLPLVLTVLLPTDVDDDTQIFYFKFLEDMRPFYGATDTPVLASCDISTVFQSQSALYLHLAEAYVMYVP